MRGSDRRSLLWPYQNMKEEERTSVGQLRGGERRVIRAALRIVKEANTVS